MALKHIKDPLSLVNQIKNLTPFLFNSQIMNTRVLQGIQHLGLDPLFFSKFISVLNISLIPKMNFILYYTIYLITINMILNCCV